MSTISIAKTSGAFWGGINNFRGGDFPSKGSEKNTADNTFKIRKWVRGQEHQRHVHTFQPPEKHFLAIGSNFPCFSKNSWFLILTIKTRKIVIIFWFYLLLHATMTFHYMNSILTDRKVTTTNCILHKSPGSLSFTVRMSRS